MKRREFVGGVGALWPFGPAMSVEPPTAKAAIGYLSYSALAANPQLLAAFHSGLAAEGWVEGRHVTVEYRAADRDAERLPDLAADLVRRQVAVIRAAGGTLAALAAKRATQTIPIVFVSGADPMQSGLVRSFSRPSGNITGTYFLLTELVPKRLELLQEMLPTAKRVALLVNPANAANTKATLSHAQSAARTLGLDLRVFDASTATQIDQALAAIVASRQDALFVAQDAFFNSERKRLVALTARYAIPAAYSERVAVEDGGLMTYGANVASSFRLAGVYVGRILHGARPTDLPIEQPTKFELLINRRTAKALGLQLPHALLLRADEVIG